MRSVAATIKVPRRSVPAQPASEKLSPDAVARLTLAKSRALRIHVHVLLEQIRRVLGIRCTLLKLKPLNVTVSHKHVRLRVIHMAEADITSVIWGVRVHVEEAESQPGIRRHVNW